MSYIYTNYRPPYPNELYHHGIKNQQWGVTNGPPYPLDRATHRAVVKQTKAEYKSSRNDVRNAAYAYRVADSKAKKADKAEAKALRKATAKGTQKYQDRYEQAKAAAKDARNTSDFYRNQYSKHLKTYTDKASALGKKAKYDESKSSIRKASVGAGHNTRNSLLYGSILGTLKTQSEIRKWGQNAESKAKFDRNSNKMAYERTKRLSKIDNDIKNTKDSRERQLMRAYRAAVKNMSNEQFAKFNAGKMKQRDLADLIENYDPY